MYFQKTNDQQYIIRINRGEEAIEALASFCRQEKIQGAFFTGIGAADEVELAHYSVIDQKYSTLVFSEPLEITTFTGNVAYHEDELIIHAHGTFSRPDMHCLGGHITRCIISGTLELILAETPPLSKTKDDQTGLKLLELPNHL